MPFKTLAQLSLDPTVDKDMLFNVCNMIFLAWKTGEVSPERVARFLGIPISEAEIVAKGVASRGAMALASWEAGE